MGVHGLWDLLAPVGRRVSVETLAGKKLAIDASIWMVQFMKAMRDEKGEMVRNAHLLGFFRRICKLLYLKTKPVFVFDGGTPALKRRTVIARRRQRENAQAKIRKTAEKLLINHLKTMRLKELAKDLENQRQKQKSDTKGKKILSDLEGNSERSDVVSASDNKKNPDKMLAASIAAEVNESSSKSASKSATASALEEDGDEDEEIILPTMDGNVDPAVLAALPASMQHQILVQQKNDAKGKKISADDSDQANMIWNNLVSNDAVSSSRDHEKLDEMLAASIAVEEDGNLTKNADTLTALFPSEEEDGDEDEEMILPAINGSVDPAVLAALPPSMQLDLLVQMRERLMAENRQKYQKVKKAPKNFSELQIQAYLKTVAFRREIDEVQKAAAGRGVGGVQTSRIASEANREFIFSSSFTGDKQVLTSSSVESRGDGQQIPSQRPSTDFMSNVASIDKSDVETRLTPEKTRQGFDDDVQTYLDERGRVRVSRVRAMGIRMTRDLQRNLDMMKEIEHEGLNENEITNAQSVLNLSKSSTLESFSRENKILETSQDDNTESVNSIERNRQSMCKIGKSIEISFEDRSQNKCNDDDDDDEDILFAHLAAGNAVIFRAENSPAQKQPSDSISDSDWEEGIVERKGDSFCNDVNTGIKHPLNLKEGDVNDESEVEWEEGSSSAPKSSSAFPAESEKTVSRGYMEEEANLQEAIRRSLLDQCGDEPNYVVTEHKISKNFGVNADVGFHDKENNMAGPNLVGRNSTQQNELLCENVDRLGKLDAVGVNNSLVFDSLGFQLKLSAAHNSNDEGILTNKSYEKYTGSHSEQSRPDASDRKSLCRDTPCAESATEMELKQIQVVKGQCSSALDRVDGSFTNAKRCSEGSSHLVAGDASNSILVDDKKNDCDSQFSVLTGDKKNELESSITIHERKNDSLAEPLFRTIGTIDPSIPEGESAGNVSMYDIDIEQTLAAERANDSYVKRGEHNMEKSTINANENVQVDVTDEILEEEMLILDQECASLGNEQKKLERYAESISSEMFAECQELLQMFGLPYIIAPMEAEAQCAYMELANLVDGVVTDDSDVFLFGARSVYKNIFDDRKYVETYFMQDIEKELGLSREKLIHMALLLGSDYTEGISGIGIVNAIEVVNAFPEEDGLLKFREWIESPDPSILGKFDVQTSSNSRKRRSKNGDSDVKHTEDSMEGLSELDKGISQSDEDKQSADDSQNIKKIFMNNHRNVSKNWHIPSSFPSEVVISAYTCPQVDKSTEPFSWGKPDLFVLRKFCWDKFGWGSDKLNELLLPVLKEYEKRETQLRLEAFYTFNERFAKIRSKRIKKAVRGITGSQSVALMNDAAEEVPKSRKKRRINCLERGNNQSREVSKEAEESAAGTQNNSMEKSTPRQSRKRKVKEKFVSSEMQNPERLIQIDGVRNANKVSRGKRRGNYQRVGQGRERGRLCAEPSETSSSDGTGGDDKQEFYGEELDGPQEVRRSTRLRKAVNYIVDDPEIDDAGKILNNKECSSKEIGEQDFGVHGSCGDASVGFSGEKQHEADDPSLEESFCRDYLESSCGFCIDEGEIGQPSVSPNDDPFLEAEISQDYLKMGGGFCVDKNETCDDQVVAQNSVVNGENGSPCFECVDRVDRDIDLGDSTSGSKGATNGIQSGGRAHTFDTEPNLVHHNATGTLNVENDDKGVSDGALTAMPFLKRRRRRS